MAYWKAPTIRASSLLHMTHPATTGLHCYIVGGAVRDHLLGRPVNDRDWVVLGSTPEEMQRRGFRAVGQDFPVFLHPESGEEYALARTERKHGRGHQGFVVFADPSVTLEEDLIRRDLTINALAETADGKIVDPFGGLDDLQGRVLRHVSPAFVEDPLRVLRVARFAAQLADYGFTVADETLALMREMAHSGELDSLTPERVWQETHKALMTSTPSVFFNLLRDVDALSVLFPEVDALFGVPQPPKYHPEIDTGIHAMLVIDAASALSDDIAVRFGALCHDLGKARTPPELWPRHIGHEQRGLAPVRDLCTRLRVPKIAREVALASTAHHGQVHRALEMRAATLVDLIGQLDGLRRPERLDAVLLVCRADARGRPGHEQDDYPQADWLQRCAKAMRDVSPQPLLERGLTGQALGDALRRERISAVRRLQQAEGIKDFGEEDPQTG